MTKNGRAFFETEAVDIASLKEHPRNYREHPDDQIDHIMQSIREHGVYRNVVIAEDNVILAGHGVVKAAKKLGLQQIPVLRLPVKHDSPKALKVLAGDNEVVRLAVDDEAMLADILRVIQEQDEAGLMGTGFSSDTLQALIDSSQPNGNGDTQYSRKVESPIYEPSEQKPEVNTLFDDSKTRQLIQEIQQSQELSADEKKFLILAAERHTVLNFSRIADYYAHSGPAVQRLMENSALVIIDFNRAIELGFVKLAGAIAEQFKDEYGDE